MIRVGVVGYGLGGRVFHCPLVASVAGLELAAVVERHTNNAAQNYENIVTYRSLSELLADKSIDLVVITTPSGGHFEAARQALDAGKSVVIDKPMCIHSAEISTVYQQARKQGLLVAPFHNRRWDSDFQTIQKLLHEGALGRLVHFESNFDRWRPVPKVSTWKDSAALGGGALLDLGTHLVDQALVLFGKPEAVGAEVLRERDWNEAGTGAEDSFTVRLFYSGLTGTLGSNCLSTPTRPRFHLRGTQGNYWKDGLDSQEARLKEIVRIDEPNWGWEPVSSWGTLNLDVEGNMLSRPVEPIAGDYRLYYAGVRDALLGKAPLPVTAVEAWRVARVLEWARQSAAERRVVVCDWSEEPE